MKRKRATSAVNAPFKKPRAALQRQDAVVFPSRPLRFQANTVGAGPEKKNLDTDLSVGAAIATGVSSAAWTIAAAQLINGVAQGATELTRVGRKIQMTKLEIIWSAVLQTTTANGCSMRFRVVYDKQANGVIPTIASIFAFDSFFSPNNLANSDRFITIVDEITEPLDQDNNTCVSGRISRKMSLETIFSGTGATVASIASGSMYLIACQNSFANTAAPALSAICRLRFIDI